MFQSRRIDSARIHPKEGVTRAEVHPEGVEFRSENLQQPINILHQTPSQQHASSLISRYQVDRASVDRKSAGTLESIEATSQASEIARANEQTTQKTTTTKEWSSFGGFLRSILLILSSSVLGDSKDAALPARYIYYCSLAMFALTVCACSCCTMEMFKCFPWKRRRQYIHKGRVIYEWTQTPRHVTLYTMLPPGLTQDDLEVKVWPKHAKIRRVGKVPFIKEGLYDSVDVDRCSWDVTWRGELTVTLAKDFAEEWPCVFTNHHLDKSTRRFGSSERPLRRPPWPQSRSCK